MPRLLRAFLPCVVAFLTAAAVQPTAHAQAANRILVGFPPGGGVDAVARLLAERLASQSGEPYIVENRAGAAGTLAVQGLVQAAPDGRTLLLAPDSNIVIYPHTVGKPPYRATDLAPISMITSYDLAFSAKGDGGPTDLKAFIQTAKQQKDKANFASPAAGSLQHFYGLAVSDAIGVELMHVPYKGVAPAVSDTIGGFVSSLVTPVGPVIPHAKSGALRILATSGETRGQATPNVPTFKELGFDSLVARGWFGLFAAPGTPDDKVKQLNQMVAKALQHADFTARLKTMDMESGWLEPGAFKAQIQRENEQWANIIKRSGFKADGAS